MNIKPLLLGPWLLVAATLAACSPEAPPAPPAATTSLPAATPAATPPPAAAPSPAEVVDALEAKFGAHPGLRRNHTKGFCFSGDFVGTAAARALSRSALFGASPSPVLGRFSLAGGNPAAADNQPANHGMALRITLPGGQLQQMAMLDVPVFDVATPAGFLAKQVATTADPATGKPDPVKLAAFARDFPESRHLTAALAGQNRIPDGYQRSDFNGLHTFFLVDAAGTQTAVRWQFVPHDGVQRLSVADAQARDADFLLPSLQQRLAQGPVQWTMRVTLANPDDPLLDPSAAWRGDHRSLDAGTLTLRAAQAQADGECAAVNFDPLVLADGIAASDDPVLHFRSPAYALSFGRRQSEAKPQ